MRLIISALVAVAVATCAIAGESNAQRLSRGLPPRSPKFGRTLPGFAQAQDDPTPAYGALRPRSSPSPSCTGKIEVRESGSVLGVVRNWVSLPHVNGVNFAGNPSEDLHVSFTPSAGPSDLLTTNPNFPAPFYVGISGASTTLAKGSRNTVDMENVPQTPGGVPASGVSTESAVWSLNRDTSELTVQYVNPDGSKPDTIIAYDIRENVLFFVGDLDAYNYQNDIPASAVQFFLVPV